MRRRHRGDRPGRHGAGAGAHRLAHPPVPRLRRGARRRPDRCHHPGGRPRRAAGRARALRRQCLGAWLRARVRGVPGRRHRRPADRGGRRRQPRADQLLRLPHGARQPRGAAARRRRRPALVHRGGRGRLRGRRADGRAARGQRDRPRDRGRARADRRGAPAALPHDVRAHERRRPHGRARDDRLAAAVRGVPRDGRARLDDRPLHRAAAPGAGHRRRRDRRAPAAAAASAGRCGEAAPPSSSSTAWSRPAPRGCTSPTRTAAAPCRSGRPRSGTRRSVARFARAGFACTTHAVGDRAVRAALDAYRAAGPAPRPHAPHRAHRDPAGPRPAAVRGGRRVRLDAAAPPGEQPGRRSRTRGAGRSGPERSGRAFRTREIWDSGALVCLGSDWPVARFDPGSAWAGAGCGASRAIPSAARTAPTRR